ncbi:16S rRNA (adenine(1518)-N(6)/adenine(1519)-N(6))-dimethyltransferase RsmA [Labrys sp. KNU-23]|uniref:16S rRNA (adenine(1518)-N(6)/adenine(1519)-N(6))- dimethyltransferase RsmA n=1 Tax=Labrys sp. KNU-23 TaxID=2789216 RepID=UPI0011ECDD90|nr:16S rRNA (adenine(1518)-N(6)/adenine(1519)-N(6))-dimethyltransferase RsmA [Labrys sp. KNU-23]QEN90363.1 16S rRNA (adenine(1518)-N(6)/adenine(1519)-N(6))-dimethyltransferase RsmA [Labrys sp. KNU-23]
MAQIDTLPPLREVIRQHELMAKKSLGQNFLLDLNLTAKIARAGGSLEGVNVVEIGPGPGGLTRALLACGARHVVAVERDERCLAALAEIAAHYPGRLTVHAGDALEADWPALIAGLEGPVRITANLPYNIATPLLIGWLKTEPWPPWFQSMTLMFQKEVAERIVATEADDAYGRLGVLAGWRTEAEIVFDVPPSAFVPPPKVTSSVVHLRPRTTPLPCTPAALERITQAAFGQRRKMLRQSLKGLAGGLGGDLAAALADTGLRPEMRAEEVPVAAFVALANALK